MADFPAMPLWTDAYLADCAHLSDAEHGRYFQILMAMWRTPDCRMPNDDQWLARKFRRTIDEVATQLRPLISEFCQSDGNWITQKRLSRERHHVTNTSRKQSDRAKSRWKKEKIECRGNATTGNAPTTTTTTTPQLEANASLSAAGLGQDFETWWTTYPAGRKQAKPKCREKYLRVVKSGQASPAQLLAGAQRYAAAGYEGSRFVKGPLVWLNGAHWTDEDVPPPGDTPPSAQEGPTHGQTAETEAERSAARVALVVAKLGGRPPDRPADRDAVAVLPALSSR